VLYLQVVLRGVQDHREAEQALGKEEGL